jgi:hypothetical protein
VRTHAIKTKKQRGQRAANGFSTKCARRWPAAGFTLACLLAIAALPFDPATAADLADMDRRFPARVPPWAQTGRFRYAHWRERTGAPDDMAAWTASHREMLAGLVAKLHAHAQRLKPDFLMYVNCNRGLYTLNRAGNAVTTEDGNEPGLSADAKVVSNIGALRYQWAVGEGWRPVRMEYGGRLRKGPFESRFTIPMTARSHQLAIAEAAAHHVGFEIFSLGRFQRDLFLREPAALDNLRAAGCYNAFLEQHEEFYVRPRSLAQVSLLANEDDRQVQASRELAERGVLFDVLFTATLTPACLARYQTLIAPDVRHLSNAQIDLLAQRVKRGSRLVISGQFGAFDERFRKRERDPLNGWFELKEGELPKADASAAHGPLQCLRPG